MENMAEQQKCNLCGISIQEKLYSIKRNKRVFEVVKCQNCGLVFMNPIPSDKEIRDMYSPGYYDGTSAYSYYDERKNKIYSMCLHKKRMENIEKVMKTKGKILDVGASFGFFVRTAERMGWDAYGVEVSKYSSDYAKNELGLKVSNCTLEQAGFPGNYFDVIHMAEVVEHLQDPKKVLKECNRILKKNGLLVIQTSDIDSIYARVMGKNWDWFLPGHLHYFSRRTLGKMLELTKFKVFRSYFGDEFSLQEKIDALKRQDKNTNLLSIMKLALVQAPRYLHFGSIPVGGVVIYAKNRY
jgi:ubiquinone/menaquinone biosynthesis C-methylase UbiE